VTRRAGFTLVELLVAIGVIAILASLVVAVGGGVLARGERTQVESMFLSLDQAIVSLEESRGQPLVFNRRKNLTDTSQQDNARFSDIDELTNTGAYIMPRLLNLLSGNPGAWSALSSISPDFLRREEKTWPDGVKTTWNLRDPWGEQIVVIPPGRPATRGEIKKAREELKAGRTTAAADSLGFGIDMGDATVRTADEGVYLKAACVGRRWLFLSKGPDRNMGQAFGQGGTNPNGTLAWDDNVLNYEPVRLNP
jgi:prepilin-type N-terminal cleavage/methylation domain-containing protein